MVASQNELVRALETEIHLKDNAILPSLRLTQIKIFFGKILYKLTRLFHSSDVVTAKRNGITYELDLSEGIDLSLYLFGNFQAHITEGSSLNIGSGGVIFDVGANIGSTALNFARRFPEARVYAFEPTDYAYKKLQRNLSLNPDLQSRIKINQCFVSNSASAPAPAEIYASWKVDGSDSPSHPTHGGTKKSAPHAATITIDEFCASNAINRLDLIKIDTDGHELSVLQGAAKTLAKFKPVVLFEIGQYLLKERGIELSAYLDYFSKLHYSMTTLDRSTTIDGSNAGTVVPKMTTTDLLAIPNNNVAR